MNKKLIIGLCAGGAGIAAIVVGVLFALGVFSGKVDYHKFIPRDAVSVTRFDTKQILEQSGVAENKDFKNLLKKALKQGDLRSSVRHKIEDIIDNPEDLGIDLREPVYMYVNIEDKKPEVGLVTALHSGRKFGNFLKELSEEYSELEPEEKDGYNYCEFDNEALMIWKSNWLLVRSMSKKDDVKDVIEELEKRFDRDESETPRAHKGFLQLEQSAALVQSYVSGEQIEDAAAGPMHGLDRNVKKFMHSLSNVSVLFELGSTESALNLDVTPIAENEDGAAALAELKESFGKDVKGSFLKYVEDDALAFLATSIDGTKIWKELKKQFKEAGMDTSDESFEMVKRVFESLKGDVTFAFEDFDKDNIEAHLFAQLSSPDALASLLSNLGNLGLSQTKENEYFMPYDFSQITEEVFRSRSYVEEDYAAVDSVMSDDDIEALMADSAAIDESEATPAGGGSKSGIGVGIRDGKCFYAASGKNFSAFKTKSKPVNPDQLKGNKLYGHVNFVKLGDILEDLPGMDDSEARVGLNFLKLFKNSDIFINEDAQLKINVTMKRDKESALAQIVDYFLKIVEELG